MKRAARPDGAARWWRRTGFVVRAVAFGLAPLCFGTGIALGQRSLAARSIGSDGGPDSTGRRRFMSATDSADWERARTLAANAGGFRMVISLLDRRLWVIIGADTLRDAPVAVASGLSLAYQGRRWSFTTPRGIRTVVAKDSLPVWVPPDWHYYEVARERGLVVRQLVAGRPVGLEDGRRLEVRDAIVGTVGPDSVFTPLAADEEIIADGFLFIPPLGSPNRQIVGELGRYRIDLGGGFLLHGTPHIQSIGTAATHGCIRLHDDDIEWLFEFVPVGVRVYIY